VNAVEAIRTSVAFTSLDHVTAVRVTGSGSFEAVDRMCPRELFVRDGQMLHTLLLTDEGRIRADLYICADDADFILLAEGVTAAELAALLRGPTVDVFDLRESHTLLSLDGPYAWEMFAELAGPEVIGQPYMTLFHADDLIAFRAGKTGEFGYLLLVAKDREAALRATLLDRGAPFDIVQGDLAALEQCALENWYFNVRREGLADVTPVELQLQWRVSARKPFAGASILAARRANPTQRLQLCTATSEVAIGDAVMYRDKTIGRLINAGFSVVRGDWVASALLDRSYAHSGLSVYEVAHGAARIPLTTRVAPVLDNRSLYVNPQLHSYQTRHEVQYPPVVPER
jgi:glycine cleavage system aminomethyltransferase T